MALRNLIKKQATSVRLQAGSHSFTFIRKHIRMVRLRIDRLGNIQLTAPFGYTEQEAIRLVENRQQWLDKHLERIKAQLEREADDYSRVLFLGVEHPTRIIEHPIAPRVTLDESGTIHLHVKSIKEAKLDKILNAWYAVELRKCIDKLAPEWELKMGVKAQSYRFRTMTSRWGSCHMAKHTITLNTQLAKHSQACIEYILVHELAHLLEAGHGPAFKSVMDKHLPDWRERKKKLNGLR